MITIKMETIDVFGKNLYQAFAYYGNAYEQHPIAVGEAKTTSVEALLSVSDKIQLFADKVNTCAKEIAERSVDLAKAWENIQTMKVYFTMDENAVDKE